MPITGSPVSDVVINDCNVYFIEAFNQHFTPNSAIIFNRNIRSFNCNRDSFGIFLISQNVINRSLLNGDKV